MVETVELAKWWVDSEPELTREAYAQIASGAAEACGCEACFNFAASRHLVYSGEVIELLEWLGIDPELEAEARYEGPLAEGHHRYAVCFYLVGRIASGPATPVAQRDGALRESLERGADVELGFASDAGAERPDAFRGLPVVRLELRVAAPWVANGPPPAAPG